MSIKLQNWPSKGNSIRLFFDRDINPQDAQTIQFIGSKTISDINYFVTLVYNKVDKVLLEKTVIIDGEESELPENVGTYSTLIICPHEIAETQITQVYCTYNNKNQRSFVFYETHWLATGYTGKRFGFLLNA